MIQRALTVEDICNKLRPVFGKKVDEMYFQYTVADGREEREEITHILNALYQKHLNQLLDKGVLLEPPREEQIDGDYNLATVSYAKRKLFDFTLREQDWPRHICVTGMSGSGKTTFAFKIVEALNMHNKPYLIFDWKKSFRPLSAKDSSIMTFTVGNEKVSNLFKTNINQPPKGVAPKEWINVLSDLLTESFSASFGVHKVILETLDQAFKEWGIYNGSDNYPTWNHIKWRLEEKLDKIQGREAGWLESALRIATVMTFGDFGKTMNYKGDNSISVEELLDKKVVMELNSLGGIEKTFFCEFILTYMYKLKKAQQNNVNHGFDYAIIVDEAHNIFLKKPTNFTNESTTDMIYREMREYGTSLICLDQHISKISDTVKGNSACHIAFQQQLPQDLYDISEIMNLRESKHYFSQLQVGTAIVKLAERYTSPFLIEVPFADMRNHNVTDEYIKNRMQAMLLNKDYENKVDPEFNKAIESPVAVEPNTKYQIPNTTRSADPEFNKAIESPVAVEPNTKYQIPNTTRSADPEFNKAIKEPVVVEPKIVEPIVTKVAPEVHSERNENLAAKRSSSESDLAAERSTLSKAQNPVHEMLYTFIEEHLKQGIDLKEIEKILEKSKAQGNYTTSDIISVVNKVFENQLVVTFKKKDVTTECIQNGKTDNQGPRTKDQEHKQCLLPDQQVFMEFLQENPEHTLSTTEVYRQIGLSARKGTNTKKDLEEKGLIKIEAIKYNKGWKKIIRLSN